CGYHLSFGETGLDDLVDSTSGSRKIYLARQNQPELPFRSFNPHAVGYTIFPAQPATIKTDRPDFGRDYFGGT
ncbi:hypothetical protein MK292_10085, partial [Myxococcota bacterium]|nr:hypothetical protein [Myxococcota bacterium]